MIITISLFLLMYKTNIVGKYCNHWLAPMRRGVILLFCRTDIEHSILDLPTLYYNHIYYTSLTVIFIIHTQIYIYIYIYIYILGFLVSKFLRLVKWKFIPWNCLHP